MKPIESRFKDVSVITLQQIALGKLKLKSISVDEAIDELALRERLGLTKKRSKLNRR